MLYWWLTLIYNLMTYHDADTTERCEEANSGHAYDATIITDGTSKFYLQHVYCHDNYARDAIFIKDSAKKSLIPLPSSTCGDRDHAYRKMAKF